MPAARRAGRLLPARRAGERPRRSATTAWRSGRWCGSTSRSEFTPEYATEVVRRFFLGRATHGDAVKYANMPARWTILQRINVGLIAILGRLGAEANWRQIAEEMWPITDRAPSTPLGREEAAWWELHKAS